MPVSDHGHGCCGSKKRAHSQTDTERHGQTQAQGHTRTAWRSGNLRLQPGKVHLYAVLPCRSDAMHRPRIPTSLLMAPVQPVPAKMRASAHVQPCVCACVRACVRVCVKDLPLLPPSLVFVFHGVAEQKSADNGSLTAVSGIGAVFDKLTCFLHKLCCLPATC